MPYEDPKFIYELLVVNPADTDQRSQGALTMRGIKNAIVGTGTVDAGSFTPNATGQYTGTMDEIQFATDNAIPTDDTTTPPVNGDLLKFNGTDWVPSQTASALPVIQYATFNTYDGVQNGQEVFFINADDQISTNGIATIKNNGDAGRGWLLTADVKLAVNISFSIGASATNVIDTAPVQIYRDIAGAVETLSQGRQENPNNPSNIQRGSVTAQTSTVLEIGQTLSLIQNVADSNGNIGNAYASVTVQAIA
jgi:hypothetical protein